jgi:hypothetical protein
MHGTDELPMEDRRGTPLRARGTGAPGSYVTVADVSAAPKRKNVSAQSAPTNSNLGDTFGIMHVEDF